MCGENGCCGWYSFRYEFLADGFIQVPVQPNMCDCGLYLLHFVETFVSNPEKYRHIILVSLPHVRIRHHVNLPPQTKRENTPAEVRRDDWESVKIAGMRARLMREIQGLSRAWMGNPVEEGEGDDVLS